MPDHRTAQVMSRVCHLLDHPAEPLPRHKTTWKPGRVIEPKSVKVLPKKVVFDNDTVDRYTIISFFAYDEVGLLYRIASTLAEHRLVLAFAKIDTHLDQVADVFYVTEQNGDKLTDPQRQADLRAALLDKAD